MSGCSSFAGAGSAGIAAALRSVDCQTGEATAFAFGRLFGADGRLLPALTLLLTLYIGFFAIQLLTGRGRLGVGSLTSRMMTLGLVLTFATSWAAYQSVVWTLATGASDQIATLITGSRGSATIAFADRLDQLFTAVSEAADAAAKPTSPTESGITPATPMVGGFTAATVLALSSAMLMLGTVGVLLTSKIALAAMLALGPVFMVFALFRATHGLFEGWCKAIMLFATIPLFAVLIGGAAVVALEPIVRGIAMEGGQPPSRAVGVLFVGASVYVALMVMALKTATTLVAGWRLPGYRERDGAMTTIVGPTTSSTAAAVSSNSISVAAGTSDDRIRRMVAGLPSPTGSAAPQGAANYDRRPAQILQIGAPAISKSTHTHRANGIGSRFRAPTAALRKEQIS